MNLQTTIRRTGCWLVMDFGSMQSVLSWAQVGGGFCERRGVVWRSVKNEELPPETDATEFLKKEMCGAGFDDSMAGLMTGVSIEQYAEVRKTLEGIQVCAVATAGVCNALRVGDPPAAAEAAVRAGTINLVCQVSVSLTKEAMVEALSIAAEARTAAVLEAQIPSRVSGLPATGTGTDCLVIAAPSVCERGLRYCGKHTAAGSLIGRTVYEGVKLALKNK